MKKGLIIVLIIIALVILVSLRQHKKTDAPATNNAYSNLSYQVEGQDILLNNGVAITDIVAGSESKTTTRVFGNEVMADINNDGMEDVAFILTSDGGGTGTFYYVVAALKTATGYTGTNAVFIGDRIAPQTTEFHNGFIVVNYADRGIGEPMTAPATIGVSKTYTVDNGVLLEIIQDTETE